MREKRDITKPSGIETFDTLFRNYYAPMVVYAMRKGNNQEDAEDAVQEVFCTLFAKWDTLQVTDKSYGLLFTMLHNKMVDMKKMKDRFPYMSLLSIKNEFEIQSEEESRFEMETYSLLYQEIQKLPRKNREIMKMKMKGMDNRDIAEALDISLHTVRNHIKNGIATLRGKFDDKLLSLIFLC